MRVAATIFWGFCVYLVITLCAVLSVNPSANDPSFAFKTIAIIGGLFSFSAFAALRLARGKGMIPACILAGYLTQVVVVGWLRDGKLQLDEPAPSALITLRAIGGLYILLLWFAIIWASWQKLNPQRRQGQAENR